MSGEEGKDAIVEITLSIRQAN
jgi:ubiquilin